MSYICVNELCIQCKCTGVDRKGHLISKHVLSLNIVIYCIFSTFCLFNSLPLFESRERMLDLRSLAPVVYHNVSIYIGGVMVSARTP